MRRAPVFTALGAIGWGAGGMMSYGIVIGYCKSLHFGNAAYGYTMLAVIGGLYGFIGGGLFGLGLETTDEKRPKWPALITEMFVFGYLGYILLIELMELKMTPPRSEAWSVCFGIAIELAWFLQREGYHRALRVAVYSSLGAGFGFSFGNFIQTMGTAFQISYNWWNVMEFTLGFCGGLGMAYAVVTREWPETAKPSAGSNWLALLIVILAIPLTNFINQFGNEYFLKLGTQVNAAQPEQFAHTQIMFGWIIMLSFLVAAMFTWYRYQRRDADLVAKIIPVSLFATSAYYVVFGYIKKGFFYVPFSLASSQSLYVPILLAALVLWLAYRRQDVFFEDTNTVPESAKRWIIIGATFFAFILIIT